MYDRFLDEACKSYWWDWKRSGSMQIQLVGLDEKWQKLAMDRFY